MRLIILTILILGLLALTIPTVKNVDNRQPPCEELVWMRDAPQARCVEYWKQRNAEEGR